MFQFTQDCMIGMPEIDEEHRHLFEIMNHGIYLADGTYTGDRYAAIKDLLDDLDDYAEQHLPMRRHIWSRSVIQS